MSREKAIELAMELLKLGVSNRGVEELLQHPHDSVERQLQYLPYRKAKRPEAFIIQAVRSNYSAPKEFYYASSQTHLTGKPDQLDEGSQLSDPDLASDPDGHRAPDHSYPDPPNGGVEQAECYRDDPIPEIDAIDW